MEEEVGELNARFRWLLGLAFYLYIVHYFHYCAFRYCDELVSQTYFARGARCRINFFYYSHASFWSRRNFSVFIFNKDGFYLKLW